MMNNGTVLAALTTFLSLALCGAAWAQEEKPPKETALEAGKAYAARMKEDPAASIREYWDMDEILRGVFGDDLTQHSEAERQEMKRMLLSFWEQMYSNPLLARALASSELGNFAEEKGDDGTAVIRFDVTYATGQKTSQAVKMKQSGGQWRVVDQATNGRWGIDRLRQQYETQRGRGTPMQALKALIKAAQEQRRPRAQ